MNKLYFAAEARADLLEIKAYITEELDNPTAARSVVGKIFNSIRILESHAYAGPSLASITGLETEYRFLSSGNYLIFYRVVAQNVYIDRVLYKRRDCLRVLLGVVSTDDIN